MAEPGPQVRPASPARRWAIRIARVAVGGAVLAWILATAQWQDVPHPERGDVTPGLWSALRNAHWGWVALALAAYGTATIAGIVRFWALLRVQGAAIRVWLVFQLTYVGLFFNLALPGHNGGDIVKIGWAARATGSVATAVAATAVDRVVGLLALSIVALVPTLLVIGDPAYRPVAIVCVVVLSIGVGTIALYLTPPVRRLFERAGGSGRRGWQAFAALDSAIAGYRRAPGAVLLASIASAAGQLGVVAAMWALGRALGLPPVNYIVVAPAIMVASALPLAPGGAGQAEAAFLYFMPVPEHDRPKVVALGLCYRFAVLAYGCLGGVVLAFARGGMAAVASVDTARTAPDSAAP